MRVVLEKDCCRFGIRRKESNLQCQLPQLPMFVSGMYSAGSWKLVAQFCRAVIG